VLQVIDRGTSINRYVCAYHYTALALSVNNERHEKQRQSFPQGQVAEIENA
jgi:hypothetical protein